MNGVGAFFGALVGGGAVGLVATSIYFISLTDYPYGPVVGGFALLGATVGGFLGLFSDV